jgi:hypothetical protein
MPGSVRARVSSAAGAERIGATNVFSANVGGRLPTPMWRSCRRWPMSPLSGRSRSGRSAGENYSPNSCSALDSRIVIEQAKGAIVQDRGVSVDEVFTLIRGYSRSHNLRLSDVARTVTTDLSAIANPQTCPVPPRGSVSHRPP